MGQFYFMAIEKRYVNLRGVKKTFLSFYTSENHLRITIEDDDVFLFVKLNSDELKELINDLNFQLQNLNNKKNEK